MKPSIIPFKNRTVDISKPVYLYRNLHLKEKGYSIKQPGKVVGRVYNNFFLRGCEFIILESERNRYLRTKQRYIFENPVFAETVQIKNALIDILKWRTTQLVYNGGRLQVKV